MHGEEKVQLEYIFYEFISWKLQNRKKGTWPWR